jgi:dTDP-4-amino-4,6-dideoxyglucose
VSFVKGEGRRAGLAICGGEPMFSRARTTGQLANRDPERFFELASGVLDRRWFTNQGPLVEDLEQRLSRLHGARHCVAFANACFPLILSLKALAKPGARKVLLPSLTFRGLPHLIRWAGLEPQYCEIEPVGHTLCPAAVAKAVGPDTAAVLAVDTVSALCDIDALEAIAKAAGVPLILDSVYGFAGAYGADPVGSRGDAAIFSLHATKLVNGFEGGYLTTNDDALAAAMRRQRTFGFGDDGLPQELGLNAKLNEIHAAMALSNLPHVQSVIVDNAARFEAYRKNFSAIPWVSFADYSRSPGTFSLVLLRVPATAPYTRDELIRILRAENALARPYYSPTLNEIDALDRAPDSLPITRRVSQEFIQMPVGDLMSIADIERLGALFAELDRDAGRILDTLRSDHP